MIFSSVTKTKKEEKLVNVVYSTSDLYSEIAAVSIVSLFDNCQDISEINVYIIDMGISDRNKRRLEELADHYSRKLVFLKNLNIEELAGMHIDVGRWHISTFSRLFLIHVLPESVKKVIYIDCDMIICHSLKELWEMDMGDTWVMSADDCRGKLYRSNIGIPEDSIYTNNGLMVIDLDAWRKNNVEKMFIDFIRRYNGDITYVDQGVLNGVFQPIKKVKLLPISYNAQTACYDLGYDGLQICRNPVWAYTREEFETGIADPIIVHFTTCFLSGTRPWIIGNQHPYRGEFIKYRNMTGWRDDPLWKDDTKFFKKIMTSICNILPKFLTFNIIRVFHVWVYPEIRIFKNAILGKAR